MDAPSFLPVSRWVAPFLGLFVFGLSQADDVPTTQALTLAVHPYLPPEEVKTRFTPLADYLSRAVGRPVEVRVGHNYEQHIAAIGADSVDIAYLGPVSYVKLVERYGKKPLLARQEVDHQRFLYGVIFVRQDSSLKHLKDIKGKRFAFGDTNSTMSHVVPEFMLSHTGITLKGLSHYAFLGSHKNVALAVLAGDYDAGAVKQEVFQEMKAIGLRALATSPPVADHVFVASAKLPETLTQKLQKALWQLEKSPEGLSVLHAIHNNMTALKQANDADFDSLRTILKHVPSKSH